MAMTTQDDGGPAFPQPVLEDPGMSLRDWFAGQALAGGSGHYGRDPSTMESIASWAYEVADAMLKARQP